jgi:hypothetical protein
MFAIILRFFGPALANMTLGLERDQPAGILLQLVNVGAAIRASIACFRG